MTLPPPKNGDQTNMLTSPQQGLRLVLLITGTSPRSQRARNGLSEGLRALDAGDLHVDEIDLLTYPRAALEFGIYASPALLWEHHGQAIAVLYGDLTDEHALLQFLNAVPPP